MMRHDHIVHLNMNDSILTEIWNTYLYEIISSSILTEIWNTHIYMK